jgi:Na+-translocating ferredoxin:NAD+ oxidoreductase RnfG subunit
MPRRVVLVPFRAMLAATAALVVGALPLTAQAAPPGKVSQSVDRIYGTGARVDTVVVDSQTVYRVSRGAALLGFAEVRNVKGKEQPITYLVAVDSAGATRDIDILVYRESQGGEVAYDSWRKQFRGKTTGDPIEIGKDIRNISGATISSNAVTRSVRLALRQLADWRAAGKLK